MSRSPSATHKPHGRSESGMNHAENPFETEDSDFQQSDFRVNISAFRDPSPVPSSVNASSSPSPSSFSGPDSSFESVGSAMEPQTFDQLFNSAYKDYLRSASDSPSDSSDTFVLEKQIRHVVSRIKEGASDGSGLNRSEMSFMQLFQIQVQLGDQHEHLHLVAKEGWRSMMNAYIQRGTFEQLSMLMATYDSMYGLHPSDRLLCLMKYHLKQGELEQARALFQEAVRNGKTDDRGFSLMAKAFANAGDMETAHLLLDEAWMLALSDPSYKISTVFYGASSDILMRAGDLPRLRDLFIRLNANKPLLDAAFYARRFKTINFLTRPSPCSSSSSSDLPSSPVKREDLVKMFELVEQSMAKHSIQPTTELRNEIIAFKLYTESDIHQMFRVLSHYVTSPDVVTLNLMLDALIHEGKTKMASTLCDAWDAQFGVKPDRSSSQVISKYIVEFCKVPIPETVALAGPEREISPNSKLNALFTFQTAAFELFDEVVAPRRAIVLTPAAMVAMCKFLVAVHAKLGPTPMFAPGLAVFIAYLSQYHYSSIPSDDKTLYSMAQVLFTNGCPELALCVTALGRKRRIPLISQAGLTSLELSWSHTFEPFTETLRRWDTALKDEGAGKSAFCARAFTRVLLKQQPYPLAAYREFLNQLLQGNIIAESSVLQNAWRLMYRACNSSWDARAFFDLERLRRRHNVPLTLNMTSQMSLILAVQTAEQFMNEEEKLQQLLRPWRNDAPVARFAEPMPKQEAVEFERLMDALEPVFMARHVSSKWYLPIS